MNLLTSCKPKLGKFWDGLTYNPTIDSHIHGQLSLVLFALLSVCYWVIFSWSRAHDPSPGSILYHGYFLSPLPFSSCCGPYLRPPTPSQVLPSSVSCPVTGSSLLLFNQGLLGSSLYSTLVKNQCSCPDCSLFLGHRTQHLNNSAQDQP